MKISRQSNTLEERHALRYGGPAVAFEPALSCKHVGYKWDTRDKIQAALCALGTVLFLVTAVAAGVAWYRLSSLTNNVALLPASIVYTRSALLLSVVALCILVATLACAIGTYINIAMRHEVLKDQRGTETMPASGLTDCDDVVHEALAHQELLLRQQPLLSMNSAAVSGEGTQRASHLSDANSVSAAAYTTGTTCSCAGAGHRDDDTVDKARVAESHISEIKNKLIDNNEPAAGYAASDMTEGLRAARAAGTDGKVSSCVNVLVTPTHTLQPSSARRRRSV